MTLPFIHTIDHIAFPMPEKITLANGIQLFGFNGAKNDILRIDLLFNSGRWSEPAPLIAETTAKLFKSGTQQLSSFDLNEQIDFYGSSIKVGAGYNTFTISLYCMHRYLAPSLALLKTCLTDIIFPESELHLLQKNALSKLKVSKEKNDYLANVTFKKSVYGEAHPYGYETTEDVILQLKRNHIIDFYQQDIRPKNCTVFIAGKYTEQEMALIDSILGKWENNSDAATSAEKISERQPGLHQSIRLKKENSVQASIVIGNELFNKTHSDYASFILLNTIFGGYFGSRLMSNIREEKGLTYGIYSSLSTLKNNGIFSIQTDTNIKSAEDCLREIYFEMNRLHNTLISEQEITLARNYLLGKFLGKTDGPFQQFELFKSYFVEGVDINKFEEYVETIKATNALSLQQLAKQYLNKEKFYEVVIG